VTGPFGASNINIPCSECPAAHGAPVSARPHTVLCSQLPFQISNRWPAVTCCAHPVIQILISVCDICYVKRNCFATVERRGLRRDACRLLIRKLKWRAWHVTEGSDVSDRDWIDLAHDRAQWRSVVHMSSIDGCATVFCPCAVSSVLPPLNARNVTYRKWLLLGRLKYFGVFCTCL
jgi:hypothetical protein